MSHNIPCTFFAKGVCTKGNACPYSHEALPGGKVGAQSSDTNCIFYLQGRCRHGDSCVYKHDKAHLSQVAKGWATANPYVTPHMGMMGMDLMGNAQQFANPFAPGFANPFILQERMATQQHGPPHPPPTEPTPALPRARGKRSLETEPAPKPQLRRLSANDRMRPNAGGYRGEGKTSVFSRLEGSRDRDIPAAKQVARGRERDRPVKQTVQRRVRDHHVGHAELDHQLDLHNGAPEQEHAHQNKGKAQKGHDAAKANGAKGRDQQPDQVELDLQLDVHSGRVQKKVHQPCQDSLQKGHDAALKNAAKAIVNGVETLARQAEPLKRKLSDEGGGAKKVQRNSTEAGIGDRDASIMNPPALEIKSLQQIREERIQAAAKALERANASESSAPPGGVPQASTSTPVETAKLPNPVDAGKSSKSSQAQKGAQAADVETSVETTSSTSLPRRSSLEAVADDEYLDEMLKDVPADIDGDEALDGALFHEESYDEEQDERVAAFEGVFD